MTENSLTRPGLDVKDFFAQVRAGILETGKCLNPEFRISSIFGQFFGLSNGIAHPRGSGIELPGKLNKGYPRFSCTPETNQVPGPDTDTTARLSAFSRNVVLFKPEQ
jgi:hypothetical protein